MTPDSHQHAHPREGGKHSHPKTPRRGLHKDWRTWLAFGLMLAAMGAYVLTLDDSIQPGSGAQDIPAAVAPAGPAK